MSYTASESSYEVLNPWADADPKPLKGIAPRVTTLAGKKVGLFFNSKRVAYPTLTAVRSYLQEKYPSLEFSWYKFTKPSIPEVETENKEKFEDWLKGVDAVITAYGD
jgi:hypothetical protein